MLTILKIENVFITIKCKCTKAEKPLFVACVSVFLDAITLNFIKKSKSTKKTQKYIKKSGISYFYNVILVVK